MSVDSNRDLRKIYGDDLDEWNWCDFIVLPETRELDFRTGATLIPYEGEAAELDENGYTVGWSEISKRLRESCEFKCQRCGEDMSKTPFQLHVHHVDQDKANNSMENLLVVCINCHSYLHGYPVGPRNP